ncbi:hypothetical protein CBS101457_002127 [Exobasidium rhododendri]|nr:hypothetical protein CBS101457_002127 [Exobasidium rhododendri]
MDRPPSKVLATVDLPNEVTEEGEDEDEEVAEITFEPFEPGNVWTQKLSSQTHRSAWRRQVYMESDSLSQATRNSSSNQTAAEDGRTVEEVVVIEDAEGSSTKSHEEQADGAEAIAEADSSKQRQRPWWSEGKIAPLLSDFDSDRRLFYLAQAGIGSPSLSTSRGQHTEEGRLAPQLSPLKQQGVTLVGNTNSACADPTVSIAITPKKKTWDATWGREREKSTSNKKQATPSTVRRNATTPSHARSSRRKGKKLGTLST